jgi:hypothetical protein
MHLWLNCLVYLHESENNQYMYRGETNKKEKMSKKSKATIMFITCT